MSIRRRGDSPRDIIWTWVNGPVRDSRMVIAVSCTTKVVHGVEEVAIGKASKWLRLRYNSPESSVGIIGKAEAGCVFTLIWPSSTLTF